MLTDLAGLTRPVGRHTFEIHAGAAYTDVGPGGRSPRGLGHQLAMYSARPGYYSPGSTSLASAANRDWAISFRSARSRKSTIDSPLMAR